MNDNMLESRIQKLEGQLRQQHWMISGLLVVALGLAGLAAATSDVTPEVKTKRLTIVNDKGENAIYMTAEKDGGVAAFFGAEGRVPVLIAAGKDNGGYLLIKGKSGMDRVALSVEKEEGEVSVWSGGNMHHVGAANAK
jgi:hypothetical protein